MTNAQLSCELLKHLRGVWSTRRQLAVDLGVRVSKVSHWVEEWQRQGMLQVREGKKPSRGHPPKEYTLSDWWIGEGV